MDRRIEKLFKTKFPKIFRDLYGDERETCMAWGFECGNGWARLIYELCHHIQWHQDQQYKSFVEYVKNRRMILKYMREGIITEYADAKFRHEFQSGSKERFLADPLAYYKRPEKPYQVVALQVKEKFGSMSFYYSGGDDFIRGLVDMTCSMTYRVCEVCGKPGKVNHGRGWRSVRCSKHRRSKNEL